MGLFDTDFGKLFSEMDERKKILDSLSKPVHFDPVRYEDSQEHEAVDDLISRLGKMMEKSSKEQRRVNIALIVIGGLTLIATVAGVILQLAG